MLKFLGKCELGCDTYLVKEDDNIIIELHVVVHHGKKTLEIVVFAKGSDYQLLSKNWNVWVEDGHEYVSDKEFVLLKIEVSNFRG